MQNHCWAYLWALTEIRLVNWCHPEALSRPLSMAKNLHLNCIFHTAWCTAPWEVQKELGRVLEQRHNVLWSTNRRQVQSEAGPNGNLHLLLVIFFTYSFSPWFDMRYDNVKWCNAMLSYECWCCWMNALEKKQFRVRYQVPLLLSTGVAMLYDRLGQRVRRTSDIPLRGVTLTFIDQMDPLAPPLPSFAVVERFDNNMLSLDCILCRSAIYGLRAREVFKMIGPGPWRFKVKEAQPNWIWSPRSRTFLWDTVTRVNEGQANIRYSHRGMDDLACMSAKLEPNSEWLRQECDVSRYTVEVTHIQTEHTFFIIWHKTC